MRVYLPTAGFVVCLPVAALAQEPPKIQAGGGFMYIVNPWVAFNSPVSPDAGPSWFAKVTGHATPHFGVVGEASVSYYDGHGQRGIPGSACAKPATVCWNISSSERFALVSSSFDMRSSP